MCDNWDKFNGLDWYSVEEWHPDLNKWLVNEEFGDREKAAKYQTLLEYIEGSVCRVVKWSYR